MFNEKYKKLSLELEEYIFCNALSGRLPGIVRLSKIFGVNKTTMNKAVWLLEGRGILEIDGRGGTFIKECRAKRRKYKIIGVNGYLHGPLYEEFMNRLNTELRDSGYKVISIHAPLRADAEYYLQFPVDGLIFHGSGADTETLRELRQNGMAIVGCGIPGTLEWFDNVRFDHYGSYSNAIKYLLSLGRRRIAFVSFRPRNEWAFYMKDIRRAFIDTLRDDFDQELFYVEQFLIEMAEKYESRHAEKYAENAFRHLFHDSENPPDAIISTQQLCVPLKEMVGKAFGIEKKDVSFIAVSYPDNRDSAYTTLFADSEALIRKSVDLILNYIANPERKEKSVLVPMPLIRGCATGNIMRERLENESFLQV